MKLIYCPECKDVVKLVKGEMRQCLCGNSRGEYTENEDEDEHHTTLYGVAVPLCFPDASFEAALDNRPESGKGSTFLSFFLPTESPTVSYQELPVEETVEESSTIYETPSLFEELLENDSLRFSVGV